MATRTQGHIVRANSKDVGDLESLGDISKKRPIKEYKAINTGKIVQVLGVATVDPISLSVLYSPDNTEGPKELENAFDSGTPISFEIELSDIKTEGTGNGTTFTWSAVVVSEFSISQEEDGGVVAKFTVAVNGLPTVTAAA